MIGKTISHYRILEELGRGGMGVVYKALDTKLGREVALKFLPPHMSRDPEAMKRFIHEARAASALDHPNICTIHEIDEAEDGQTFIVMAYYEGETLKDRVGRGPIEIKEALDIAYKIAEGLGKAHEKSIVHRDIKPANIVLTAGGQVKLMDFGLAKLRGQTILTREGTTFGTISYMSPEQTRGDDVDHRADIWSLGVLLYEMITGQRPFKGDYDQAVIYSILNDDPEPPSSIRTAVPPALERIIQRVLRKDPEKRYQTIREFQQALMESGKEFSAAPHRGSAAAFSWKILRRPAVSVPVLAVIVICVLLTTRYVQNTARIRWATQEVLPTILELVEDERCYDAYELALQINDVIPSDPLLVKAWDEMTSDITIITEPQGARVFTKEYNNPNGEWLSAGRTPLESIALPKGFLRWRIEKDGYEPIELAQSSIQDETIEFTLNESGTIPEGMVHVPGGRRGAWIIGGGRFNTELLPDFFMDRFEVTNLQFKAFVDAGGYRERELWRHPFIIGGLILSWEEAMELFRDRTGRPGPATWELESFPDGEEDYPVTGVSWYEAAAYAEFTGKSLPSIHHWIYAAAVSQSAYIIPHSNFSRKGLTPVGSNEGLGWFGDYDIAGNVREWCFNASRDGRYIMGGCWDEPSYMFNFPSILSPFDRSECNGFRCIQLLDKQECPDDVWKEVQAQPARDYSREKVAVDDIFEAFKDFYRYEKTPLNAEIEHIDDEPEHWTIEKISFDAVYGRERMFCYLFLPRGIPPPYQTVVLFPGAYALDMRSSKNGRDINSFDFVDFVIRSGRSALCPVYKSTYERGDGYSLYDPEATLSDLNTHILLWWKDLSRSVDYLETRDDIDTGRIVFMGSSWGAWMAPLFLAQDTRYRTAVLRLCGFPTWEMQPAFDSFQFAPHVTIPVLMLNGRYDYIFPHETSQMPMFEMLGTPSEHKRHIIFETAHGVYGHRNEMIREVLDWLDRYLGPVEKSNEGDVGVETSRRNTIEANS